MLNTPKNSKNADELDFNNLVHYFSLPLYIYARKNMRDNIDAEDIVQDCLVRLWEKRNRLGTINSIKSYLYAMVRNECFLRLKNRKIVEYHDSYSYPISDSLSEEDECDQEFEIIELLLSAIDTLPLQSKNIMTLAVKGLKNSEIAEELDIAENTVRSMKVRSLKKLKDLVGTDIFMFFI